MNSVDRLYQYFAPENYKLHLSIHRKKRIFSGKLSITGIASSSKIVLHSKDLEIVSIKLNGQISSFSSLDQDRLALDLPAEVGKKTEINIEYSGTITDAMHGMYPCYFEHDGIDKELIATQFESHHAREVLPCIDEPEAKATFDLSLETEADVTVLGNMPIVSQATNDNRLTTTFETTPKMSTYLLAWVYGELHSKSTKTNSGIEVNIWATPAQPISNLEFALDVAKRSIEFYEDYFGVKYPLPKSDHVALPDFSSGAMENWGLITYRETALLGSKSTSGIDSLKTISKVVSHELAHQWFGNLVTMRWWDDLWLNESFANMMEYLTTNHLFPEWDMWLDFATSETVYALRRDAIDGVQPVKVDVHHPDEIGALFDPAIVYAKGSKLIKMLLSYVGEKSFREGLKLYFSKHAYSNTEGSDLWEALSSTSGKDVAKFMNSWLTQPGYPLISANVEDKELVIDQEQFFIGEHAQSNRIWPTLLDSNYDMLPDIFETKNLKVRYVNGETILLNQQDNSHSISMYDENLLHLILDKISSLELSPTQRFQILNDYILLARGSKINTSKLLDLLQAYSSENTHQVWDGLFMALAEFRKFVESDEKSEKALKNLSGKIAKNNYEKLGWDSKNGESENDTLLRTTILSLTLYSEDKEAISKARKTYDETKISNINPEIRPLILSAVTRHGDDKIVKNLLELYVKESDANIRDDICVAITSTKSIGSIKLLLDSIKDQKVVRLQDISRWYAYLVRGRDSRELTWQWLKDNWGWIEKTFDGDKSYDDFPRYTATALSTKKQLEDYISFFKPLSIEPALTRAIEMGISEIEARVKLIERDGPEVREALLNL